MPTSQRAPTGPAAAPSTTPGVARSRDGGGGSHHSAVPGRAGLCLSLSPAVRWEPFHTEWKEQNPAVRTATASSPVVGLSCDFRRPVVSAPHAQDTQGNLRGERVWRERDMSDARESFGGPGVRAGTVSPRPGGLGPGTGTVSVGAGRWTSHVAWSTHATSPQALGEVPGCLREVVGSVPSLGLWRTVA